MFEIQKSVLLSGSNAVWKCSIFCVSKYNQPEENELKKSYQMLTQHQGVRIRNFFSRPDRFPSGTGTISKKFKNLGEH